MKLKFLLSSLPRGIDKASYFLEGTWIFDYLSRMLSLHVFCREIKLCRKLMIKFELAQRHKVYNFVVGLSKFETIYFLMVYWKIVKLGNWYCRYVFYIIL